MNVVYLATAKQKQPNVPLLINMVSRRVKQLNAGQRPMVKPDFTNQSNLDLALKEVAEGMLDVEITYDPAKDRRKNLQVGPSF
jgi:DNA-directed RNA polymerase subunit omega